MNIPLYIKDDLLWWKDNILTSTKSIEPNNFILEIFSDASTTGWGAACGGERTGGQWTAAERANHINYLELLAVLFGLKSFAGNLTHCDILLRVDNTTAISYVNRMGGVQYEHLNSVAKDIWDWCEERQIFIFASYIKSSLNVEADSESRKVNLDTEWELNANSYQHIKNIFGEPDVDLFASRVNSKCSRYISWKRDPFAFDIDAFTINWSQYFFTPFLLLQ